MTTKKRLKQKIAYLQEDNFERHEIIVRLKKEKAILSESCRLLINDNSVLVDLIDGKVPVKDKNGVTIKHFDIVLVEDYPMQGVRTVSECKTHLALVARGDVGNLLIFSNSSFQRKGS